jgi:hypothetical protein
MSLRPQQGAASVMTETPNESWDPARRVSAGTMLGKILRGDPERARAFASGLSAYQVAFPDLAAFIAAVEAGGPGALELALPIAAALDPESVVEPARVLLPGRPWRKLGSALAKALGEASSEESFALLLDSPRVPYLRDGLAKNRYAGGVSRAWAAYRAVGGLDREGLTPEERVDTEPVLSYLLRHDREAAFAELVRLVRSERGGTPFVAHSLAGQDPDGHAVLLAQLENVAPSERLTFAQKLAVKLLLEKDASTAVDRLGGAPFLGTSPGRPKLSALLDWIRDDTWRIKKGWLASDPRIAQLCAGLKGDADRPLAALAADLVRTLPPELRPKSPRQVRKPPTEQTAPDPRLIAELETIRAALERLVAHLKAIEYRFAQPRRALVPPSASDLKALARLEKKVVVPAALAAFWRTVGSVDLRGWHPTWSLTTYLGFDGATEPVWLVDPLVIAPATAVIAQALEEAAEPPFPLHVAPDAVGKAGYSGGLLTLWLPQNGADPQFDASNDTLMASLRRSMAWAGFPGFAAIADRPDSWIAAARTSLEDSA